MKKTFSVLFASLCLLLVASCAKKLPEQGMTTLTTALDALVAKNEIGFVNQVANDQQRYAFNFLQGEARAYFLGLERYEVVSTKVTSDSTAYAHTQFFYPTSGTQTLNLTSLWLCFKKVGEEWKIDFKETEAKERRINGSSAFTGISFGN